MANQGGEFMLHTGQVVSLSSLHADGPLALVLLRHLGCIFCRYQVSQLRSAEHLNVCFVCMEDHLAAREFRARMRSPHPFLSDPDRKLYTRFGIGRTNAARILMPKTMSVGFKAFREGNRQGKPTADPMQLGGAAILDRSGNVRWTVAFPDASDIVSINELEQRLAAANEIQV